MNICMAEIVIDEDIRHGKPIIKGTRITVSTILEFLSAGDSFDEILKAYPSITKEDILACLNYARKIVDNHSAINTAS